MWYFYLSSPLAAKAVACLAGRARFFSWQEGSLFVLPEKKEEKTLLQSLAALGIFPSEKT